MNISVIIPVYNAEKYVAQAVESALQFEEVYEVILIEDKSPDNALIICEELTQKYDRVKLFQHPDKGNHGASTSRNLGI
jgi:glycosyltransferase involved in cell wall biosynthesis